jgi:hypothetical protein
MTAAMLKDVWKQRLAQAAEAAQACKRDFAIVQKQIDGLLVRIIDVTEQSVSRASRTGLTHLSGRRSALEEKARNAGQPRGTFEELFELAVCFLSSPSKLWEFGSFH